MRKIWPNFDFNPTTVAGWDFNGDNAIGGSITLYGPECLVFFLGGMRATPGSGPPFAMIGFSKNPANPFLPALGSETRDGPFLEFKSSQLHQSLNPDAGGALVYYDPLPGQTMPYVYASSNEGRGYDPRDLYAVPAPMFVAPPSNQNLLGVYFVGATPTPQKNKSFQIISAGVDGSYGNGGAFDISVSSGHLLSDKRDYDNITNFNSGTLNR
jgi:hypothetical protein